MGHLRAKTGWGWSSGTDAGWWVGYVEKKENVFFFATRLTKPREDKNRNFQAARLGITKRDLEGNESIVVLGDL